MVSCLANKKYNKMHTLLLGHVLELGPRLGLHPEGFLISGDRLPLWQARALETRSSRTAQNPLRHKGNETNAVCMAIDGNDT